MTREVRYMISDAAKKINVEPHVLRYWEEELGTEIPRNEMGHRYYREEDIQMMRGVKYLKEKGFLLKSIKILLPEADKVMELPQRRLLELRDRLELAVSKEELRQQREEELRQCEKEECTEKREEDAVACEQNSGMDKQNVQEGDKQDSHGCKADAMDTCVTEKSEKENEAVMSDKNVTQEKKVNWEENDSAHRQEENKKETQNVREDEKEPSEELLEKTEKENTVSWKAVPVKMSSRKKQRVNGENTAKGSKKETGHLTVRVIGNPKQALAKGELQKEAAENMEVVQTVEQAERMNQFKNIMNEIIMDVMRENNKELTGNITASVSREIEYHIKKHEMMQEEHFKQLDRTLREYQLGQKQAAVAKECTGRRESKFFKKNGKMRI